MNALQILQAKNINPDKAVLRISRQEALEGLIETMREYCPSVILEDIEREDLETLLDSLGENIIKYHPENYHQERGALLTNINILRKYGLTNEEETALDFA